MRVIFMGTPDFAVNALKKLLLNHDVVAVFTQPDKPKGRSKTLIPSPVKKIAENNNIRIYQPKSLRKFDKIEELIDLNPDVIVVAAYGQILPSSILNLPKYGCINIHASILPKYRGAAPINYAIINGESETGVTIMKMDEGLDTGDIIKIETTKISDNDTDVTIGSRLSEIGANLLIDVLDDIDKSQKIISFQQDDSLSTYAPMMEKSLGYINFNIDAKKIDQIIRGITIWPTATFILDGKRCKIYMSSYDNSNSSFEPSTISDIKDDYISIQCSEGQIKIFELQLEGKKRMPVREYIKGAKLKIGDKVDVII